MLDDLLIQTKDNRLIPFRPNQVQWNYLKDIDPSVDTNSTNPIVELRGKREILLKARQFGFSTLFMALFMREIMNKENMLAAILAHDADSTERLFRRCHLMYENLPPHKQPRTKYASKRELYFPDLNSGIFIGTAGAKDFGRSATINLLHGSEVASWENAEALVAGLFEAVPMDGFIVLETTAKGTGNYYHQEYVEAVKGKSIFTPRFYGWHQHPEYRLPTPDVPIQLSEEEEELQTKFSLDIGQLMFRRMKTASAVARKTFPQEYPATWREAFLSSGSPYFNMDVLVAWQDYLEENPPEKLPIPEEWTKLRSLESHEIELFELPEDGQTYIVCVDCAEGLNEYGDHDYDAVHVINNTTWDQVACLHGKWGPHHVGPLIHELAVAYNNALVVIERNNHGHAVIESLMGIGYPLQQDQECSGIYQHIEYDQQKLPKTRRPGFPTTPKTKYLALDQLAAMVDQEDLVLRSLKTVIELSNYVKKPGGKAGGEGKSHDDLVTSLAVGAFALNMRARGGWATSEAGRNALKSLMMGHNVEEDQADETAEAV